MKTLINSLAKECPQEILAQAFNFLNNTFEGIKESLSSEFINNYSKENKDKLWEEIGYIYLDILRPLEIARNQVNANNIQQDTQMLNNAIRQYQMNKGTIETSNDILYWPNPLDINFIQQKVADDVATICCKIGPMEIPYAMIDTGSDCCVISDNIVKRLGLEIDRRKKYRIEGYASYADTIGTVSDIPITIGNGDKSVTQSDKFSIVKAEKDKYGKDKSMIVLGTPWQYKVGWTPVKDGVFEVNHHGILFKIPMSVHKTTRKNLLNNSQKTSFGIKKK